MRIAEVFRELADFRLVRLKPTVGSFVIGFGQSFELTGEYLDQLAHADAAAVKDRAGASSGA